MSDVKFVKCGSVLCSYQKRADVFTTHEQKNKQLLRAFTAHFQRSRNQPQHAANLDFSPNGGYFVSFEGKNYKTDSFEALASILANCCIYELRDQERVTGLVIFSFIFLLKLQWIRS